MISMILFFLLLDPVLDLFDQLLVLLYSKHPSFVKDEDCPLHETDDADQ